MRKYNTEWRIQNTELDILFPMIGYILCPPCLTLCSSVVKKTPSFGEQLTTEVKEVFVEEHRGENGIH